MLRNNAWSKVRVTVSIIFLILLGFSPLGLGKGKTIAIRGSTTVLPIAQRLAERYHHLHPEVSISVSGGGSGVGIKALLDGMVDVANASRPMKTKEWKIAEKKGIKPHEQIIAKDGIAVVVHPTNPISELTMTQIKEIYAGRIDNWSHLGGPDHKIVVVSRESASGTYECFYKIVMKKEKVTPAAILQAANAGVLNTVAQTEGAIGYIGLGYISEKVKPLKINGCYPTPDAVRRGIYPISRPLFMYTRGEPKGAVADFINFVLSPEGQRIVQEEGFVPIRPTK
ncbi:MAG: phosphate ABC transporter substrate-binding protein [Deltaproteobacteria bacterium]|nr:MAG: phosphate ABC transporter substrate-binding protein [Deltaproteobacteria bacterium]